MPDRRKKIRHEDNLFSDESYLEWKKENQDRNDDELLREALMVLPAAAVLFILALCFYWGL